MVEAGRRFVGEIQPMLEETERGKLKFRPICITSVPREVVK